MIILCPFANHIGRKFKCHKLENHEILNNSAKMAYAKNFDRILTHEFLEKVYSNQTSHLQVKCFNTFPIDSFIEHMGKYLQPRRIPVE